MNNIQILPISALKDNYIWLLYDERTRNAFIVDPGDAIPVINTLKQHHLTLSGIVLTHHHRDHSGGIDELLRYAKNSVVYGSEKSPIQSITHRVKENDEIICLSFKLSVLEIPGHTLDHIAFYNSEMVFSGDTLFSFGCGKIFEGTPAQFYHSLNKLMQLPDNIRIYCGHEYTLSNLNFAQRVEPNNLKLTEKINEIKNLREKNTPTLPSVLSIEKQFNPFLRCDQAEIIQAVEQYCQQSLNNPVDVFAKLREWKNSI